ncbi:DUF6191 domain-containing protein [Streptomyces sp. NBC_01799]|uniref:DUF6191 domain-containing protein n=1 Tax=Streptomyces sp. NBC_01800 TaxID=2975945 RepID=UPI002DD7BA35|nr:DUF6191 domain-containing protein [Streptomyces sp. NBC_01800]WSA70753.1 DUF6191 domain-containing protein [Streptomyces sp. NBC_01800]WSA79251.1 DUF6191 domain-containing protein [Streptomyces sp. NBC_01799]
MKGREPVFNFFEELFAPGRKHAAEEQKRLELTRVDLGVGDPGRGPIDLASGKVTVRLPEPEDEDRDEGDDDDAEDGPSSPSGD